jgi:putative flippase GtrA
MTVFSPRRLLSSELRALVLRSPRMKLLRYAVSGVLISIGYSISAIAFVDWHWLGPAMASAVSFVLWTPISYYVHRDFTFLFEGEQIPAMAKFVASFVVRLIASAYTVQIAATLGLSYIVGLLANWLVLPLLNYVILHFWVFRTADEPTPVHKSEV